MAQGHKQWVELTARPGRTIFGLCVGGAMLMVALFCLWWNEGRPNLAFRGQLEGVGAVQSIDSQRIDPAYEGRLVHLTGQVKSYEELVDPLLGIELSAIALIRHVEMYQWQEQYRPVLQLEAGNRQAPVASTSYRPVWSAQFIDSLAFRRSELHSNPTGFPIAGQKLVAGRVSVGVVQLSEALIAQIGNDELLSVSTYRTDEIPRPFRERVNTDQPDWLYIGDPMLPEIGDLRIQVSVTRDQTVSVMGRQVGSHLEAWVSPGGTTIEHLTGGTRSAEWMFARMPRESGWPTRAIRLFGGALLLLGCGFLWLVCRRMVVP